MVMKIPFIVLVCSIILTFLLSSVSFTQTQWRVFNENNSPFPISILNSGAVGCDGNGNVWIGTDNGLYKYDGMFWNKYDTFNSGIPYNEINKIFVDRLDNLWFNVAASPYPYFVKFDGSVWEQVDTNQNCYSSVTHWVIDGYGTKWFRKSNSGGEPTILRYDGFSCIEYNGLHYGFACWGIFSFLIDHNDNFWFSAEDPFYYPPYGGIARTSQNGWITRNWNVQLGLAINSNNNEVWVTHPFTSTLHKLNYDNLDTETTYLIPGTGVDRYGTDLITDLNDNLWMQGIVSADYMGLLMFNTATEDWTLYDVSNSLLPANEIRSIAVDIYNNKWIGTVSGLSAFNEAGLILPTQITTKDTLNFGEVLVDSIVTESLIVYNTTSENLLIDSIDITLLEFSSIVSLPVSIQVGDSMVISIDFHPDSVKEYTGKLTLFTNKGMYIHVLSGIGVLTLDIDYSERITMDYYLIQNYPNPFNPSTTISYQIPKINFVTLKVYDVLGNEITILVNNKKPAGSYEIEWNASDLPSGIYFYQLHAGSYIETKKMILLK
jgi:hypothetical protein